MHLISKTDKTFCTRDNRETISIGLFNNLVNFDYFGKIVLILTLTHQNYDISTSCTLFNEEIANL